MGEGTGPGIGEGTGGGEGGGPFRPGSGIEPPKLLREVKADYTDDARRAGIEGEVVLEIVVRRDGSVGDVRVRRARSRSGSARHHGGPSMALRACDAPRRAGGCHRRGRGRLQVEVVKWNPGFLPRD